ncbi:hypothetical protein MUP29_03995, partial [bacterium]|nr:hypothetical protein [bacterium]
MDLPSPLPPMRTHLRLGIGRGSILIITLITPLPFWSTVWWSMEVPHIIAIFTVMPRHPPSRAAPSVTAVLLGFIFTAHPIQQLVEKGLAIS